MIRGPGSNEDQAWDNINIEGDSKNIWVDHCEFWDGQDGNADVVKGADTVTFTWNIFGYTLPGHPHNLSNLIASSDSEPESEGKGLVFRKQEPIPVELPQQVEKAEEMGA